jgi:hypothetical protein
LKRFAVKLLKRIFCLQLPVDHRAHGKCSITQAEHLKSLAFEYLSLRFQFAGDLSTTLNQKQPRNLRAKETPKNV